MNREEIEYYFLLQDKQRRKQNRLWGTVAFIWFVLPSLFTALVYLGFLFLIAHQGDAK